MAAISTPLVAPGLMYGAAHVFAVTSGGGLSYSLADFYRLGLPYAYGIFALIGMPIFAVLLWRRIHKLLAFVVSGAAIFPILIVVLAGYAAIRSERLSLSASNIDFIASAIISGAALGAIFWAIALGSKA